MIETMLMITTLGSALRRNRWYIVSGLGLFGLVEVIGRWVGWS